MVDRIKNFFNSKLNGQPEKTPAAALSKLKTQRSARQFAQRDERFLNRVSAQKLSREPPHATGSGGSSGCCVEQAQNSKLLVIALAWLLSSCGGYPRLLSYPFDPGGQSLNSSASDLTPQITGRYIVFTSDRFGSQDVYLFDAVNRSLIELPGLNSFDAITSDPDVSENGRFIVFTASRQGRLGIFFYDRETRSSRNLTANLPAEVRNPTISADGNRIAFESSANGQWDILVYDRSGRPLSVPTAPR